MTAPKFIEIDGKLHLWRDIVKLRQEQLRAAAEAHRCSRRSLNCTKIFAPCERNAATRYLEPSLFS